MNKRISNTVRKILTSFSLFMLFALPGTAQEFFYHTGFKTGSLDISAFAFTKGGKEVLVAEGAQISRYAVRTGKREQGLPVEHTGRIMAMDISPDAQLLASGGDDGRIILYNPSGNIKLSEINEFPGMITRLKFSPDNTRLLAGDRDGAVMLYDLSEEKVLYRFDDHSEDLTGAEFNADGSLFATSGGDGKIFLYETSSGKQVAQLDGHKSWVRDIKFSPQGTTLYSCGDDVQVVEWDLSDPDAIKEISRNKIGHSWITSLAVHPDGDTYATGNLMGVCKIITPFEIAHAKSRAPVNQVSFVPGKLNFYRIMVATGGNGLQIFDARDMKSSERKGEANSQ